MPDSALHLLTPLCYCFLPNQLPYVGKTAKIPFEVEFDIVKAKQIWKKIDVITWMFRAAPMLTGLMCVDKLAECENDTVWHWAEFFRKEVGKLTHVDIINPTKRKQEF